MATRTRLSPEERRAQLLDLGAELFAAHPYEDVHIEAVAETAGVSRGLLYHYFPNKRAFLAALLQRSSAEILAATTPDPALGPLEQLNRGIELYLTYCEANKHASRAVHRGAASADPEVLEILERAVQVQEQRIVDALEPDRKAHPLLVIAVRSWIMFQRTVCQEWLESPQVTLADARDLCVNTLVGAVANLPEKARPKLVAELLLPQD
ncbi:MAG: TetR family transcriptional regulator [Marmoricola sp.]|nr:TetR family transcriptional regulator [Marmoricola sp.]